MLRAGPPGGVTVQVSRTRLLVAGVAAGLAGVLALAAAQACGCGPRRARRWRRRAEPAPAAAWPGRRRGERAPTRLGSYAAPAGAAPGDAAAKRAAAAREERGSAGRRRSAAAKRAPAAQERRGSGSDNLLRRPDTAGSIARETLQSEAPRCRTAFAPSFLSEERRGLNMA